MRKQLALIMVVCVIAALGAAPAAAKKKPTGKVATSLYLHGTQPAGEMEAFVPMVHEDLLLMDATVPTSEEKSKQITNYGAGPNTMCSGDNLFPAWLGETSGNVVGDIEFSFTAIGTPGLVDIKVWADVPGGTDFCNEGYLEPDAQALGVALPASESDVKATLKGGGFNVKGTLLVQVSPSTMDIAGAQRPGTNVFFSRIEYDSEGHPSALSFACRPPAGRSSCTP